MSISTVKLYSIGRVFALGLLAAAPAYTQTVDDEILDLEPGVDTSEVAYDENVDADASSRTSTPGKLEADVQRRATSRGVMDEIELGRSEITGNQELPKVLYIVPWQKSDPGDLMGRPVNSLLDEVLAPLNRDEFTRHVDYYNTLYSDPDG